MSTFLQPTQSIYPVNKKKHGSFQTVNEDTIYNFKYVPVQHFNHVVKSVKRNRIRENEEYLWATFVKDHLKDYGKNDSIAERVEDGNIESQYSKIDDAVYSLSCCDSKESCDKSTSKIDTELKRLQEDTVPEMEKGIKTIEIVNRECDLINENKSISLNFEKGALSSRDRKKHSYINKKTYRKHNQSLHVRSMDCVSSPDCTNTDRSNLKEANYTRPNPQATYKILTMQRKVVELLDEILLRLGQIPTPDSDIDLQRRQQRVAEFSIRFSRNYLYNLTRCMAELQRHVYSISSDVKMTTNRRSFALHMRAVEQKLIDAYQLLAHALIAYCKHLPNSVLKGSPGKLENVLQIVTGLQNICEKIQLNTTYFGAGDDDASSLGKDMLDKCNEILCKLKANSESDLLVPNNIHSLQTRNKKRNNRKNIADRYNMYMEKDVPKNRWKSKIDARKPRKNVTVDSVIERKYGLPANNGLRENIVRHGAGKRSKQQKEDDIKTVMDMLPIDSDEKSFLEPFNYTSMPTGETTKSTDEDMYYKRLVKNLKNLSKLDRGTKNKESTNLNRKLIATDEQLASLVPVVADLMVLLNDENGLRSKSGSSTPLNSVIEILQKHKNLRRRSTNPNAVEDASLFHRHTHEETETGNRNTRLIYMTSDQNIETLPRYCEASCQTYYDSLEGSLADAEARNERNLQTAKQKIRLSVSEKTRNRVMNYKHEYQELTKQKSMYVSNTQNKPWEIVAWISDKLVDDLIVEIAKELEMDDVIQKLLDLEFREF